MQGGGVCIFGSDCEPLWNNAPGLFEALSDQAPSGGIMSNDPAQNDFADWTKVFLPYCNQDVFAGGGRIQAFPNFDFERHGSVNVRAAVEYVRNVLWLLLDQESGDGYRPVQIVAAFGGWSAGGFGTLYNYHWVLDDLQWPNTTAFADASLALDSRDPLFSVRVLGGALQALWDALPVFPPYCIAGDCAVGPDLYAATAPRLKAVPNQQMLILTGQNDGTQVNTTFFPSTAAWINTARTSVCDTRNLNGITDRMQEGNFVQQVPGVNPFACAVAPQPRQRDCYLSHQTRPSGPVSACDRIFSDLIRHAAGFRTRTVGLARRLLQADRRWAMRLSYYPNW